MEKFSKENESSQPSRRRVLAGLSSALALTAVSPVRVLAQERGLEGGVSTLHEITETLSRATMFEGVISIAEQLRKRGIITAQSSGIGGGVPVSESPYTTTTYFFRNTEFLAVEYNNTNAGENTVEKARLAHFDVFNNLHFVESWELMPPRADTLMPRVAAIRSLRAVLREDLSLDCTAYPLLRHLWQINPPAHLDLGNHGLVPLPSDYQTNFSTYRIEAIRGNDGTSGIGFVKKEDR